MALPPSHRRGRVDAEGPAALRRRPPGALDLIGSPGGSAGAALGRAYRLRLIVILGCLAAFAPLSIDMYLPAFPALADDFDTSASHVQLTLAGFLVGLAIGQVVIGSLSDQLGRRGPLLAGLALYVVASALCALAPTVDVLIACRFVQGLAGAAGIVMSRTIVRDLYTGVPAVRFFARLMLVNGAAPILAPSLGGGILHLTSWRGIFAFLACVGAVILLAALLGLRESHPPELRRAGGFRHSVTGFAELLRHRVFVGYALGLGLALGAMFAFIAGGSFALQEVYGLSPQAYALAFGVNAIGIVGFGQVSGLLAGRVAPRTLLLTGLSMMVAGTAALVCATAVDARVGWFLAPLFLTFSGAGFVMPNATVLAMADHGHLAGSASALLGVVAFPIGAAVAPLVGVAGSQTAVPMAVAMAVLAGGAMASIAGLTRRAAREPGDTSQRER